jgi:GMP synthase PP-ATPase subunit
MTALISGDRVKQHQLVNIRSIESDAACTARLVNIPYTVLPNRPAEAERDAQ